MALHIILTDWVACGYVLSLLVAAGAALRRDKSPPAPADLDALGPAAIRAKWDGPWCPYAEIRGKLPDDRVQIRSAGNPGAGVVRGSDGAGLRYA